jgi:hypothetical protein
MSSAVLQTVAGALVLTVLAVVGAKALLGLRAGLAAGLVLGLVLVDVAVRIVAPLWAPWLPSTAVLALLSPGGLTMDLYRNRGLVGTGEPVFVHVGQLQAGAVLGLLTAALVVAALAVRRSAPRRPGSRPATPLT